MKENNLKIGVYGSPLAGKRTGIGNYIFYLLKNLESILPKAKFFVISQLDIEDLPFSNKENFTLIVEKNPFLRKLPKSVWLRYFSHRLINRLNLNVFWSGIPILPNLLKTGVTKIITVHDFNVHLVPETMKTTVRLGYKIYFNKSIREAHRIVTVSEGTAKKLSQFYSRQADAVVHPGVDLKKFKILNKQFVKDYLIRKNLNKYILFVSTIEPRKNLDSLIDAFMELKAKGRLKHYKLVIAGDSGWKNRTIKKKIKKFSSEILYLKYVPEEELPLLYNGADLFVLPSIYEGFGMPAQEARACGCCVMVSDIPELHESAGPGAIYVKPTKEGLKEALSLFEKGKLSCDKEKLREGLFLWEEEAKKLAEVLIK